MLLSTDRAGFVIRVSRARQEIYGASGASKLAEDIGVPPLTWSNYERGVVMPDVVLLRFVCLTGAAPLWLLTGEGQPFSTTPGRSNQAG